MPRFGWSVVVCHLVPTVVDICTINYRNENDVRSYRYILTEETLFFFSVFSFLCVKQTMPGYSSKSTSIHWP
jgi:hypothetical protein